MNIDLSSVAKQLFFSTNNNNKLHDLNISAQRPYIQESLCRIMTKSPQELGTDKGLGWGCEFKQIILVMV